MPANMYSKFLEDCLKLGFKGKSSLASALSATPTVHAVVLKGYVFDVTHETTADLTGVSAIEQLVDGEDANQIDFTNGVLWMEDGGPASPLVADEADGDSIVIYVDHGSWTRLAFHIPIFEGVPFSIQAGDQPVLRWPRDGRGIIQMPELYGSSDWFKFHPGYWQQMIGGILGGSARTSIGNTVSVKVDWLNEDARFVWGHKSKADIPDSWWAVDPPTPKALTVNVTNYSSMVRLSASASVAWTTPDGRPGTALLLWDDTGTAATSLLIAEFSAALNNTLAIAPMHGQSNVTLDLRNEIVSLVPVSSEA